MAFQDDMVKEVVFFIREKDQEVTLYKLGKIGIKKSDLVTRTMPHSAIRRDYVAKIESKDFIFCINCDHVKLSHEKTDNNDTCWGLNDGVNCTCKKFIDVEGKRLD
jgi:hypothetical protein